MESNQVLWLSLHSQRLAIHFAWTIKQFHKICHLKLPDQSHCPGYCIKCILKGGKKCACQWKSSDKFPPENTRRTTYFQPFDPPSGVTAILSFTLEKFSTNIFGHLMKQNHFSYTKRKWKFSLAIHWPNFHPPISGKFHSTKTNSPRDPVHELWCEKKVEKKSSEEKINLKCNIRW